MDLSIIIPVYNHEKYIEQAIRSMIKGLTYNVEVIVVNDASTDNSINKVKQLQKEFSNIKILENDKNHGCAYSINRGLEIAQGLYIGINSSDDFVDEGYYQKMLDIAFKKDADVVCANIAEYNEELDKTTYCNIEDGNLVETKYEYTTEPIEVDSTFLLGHWTASSSSTKIIKKEYFDKYKFIGTKANDIPCIYPIMAEAKKIIYYPKLYKYYRVVEKSLSRKNDEESYDSVAESMVIAFKLLDKILAQKEKEILFFNNCMKYFYYVLANIEEENLRERCMKNFYIKLITYQVDLFESMKNSKYFKRFLIMNNIKPKMYKYLIQNQLTDFINAIKIKKLLGENMKTILNPKITILIPVYNGSNFIKQAIESAINQTYKNIEILVINDGSTDNGKTEKAIMEFGDKVRYIKKENGGVASALNLGIREATGEYIAWLSHDDVYLPNKIEKQVQALENVEDDNTIIFSNFELIDENGITFSTTDFTKNIEKEKFCQGIYPVLKGAVNGCAILIPKICFEDVGYFKEELKTTNDYEMWIRLFGKYPSYFIEEPTIKYRIHPNQDTNKNPVYISECNELWKNIINALSEETIKNWGFDIFNVYMTLYIQMKNSRFDEAAKLAYEKAKSIYKKITPKVSIAMPCYNSSKHLEKAIESILEQTYCNFELLIVDDKSTDNTMEKIKQYAEKDFRIKVLSNEFEKGVSGAMNTAIKHAVGEYLTRMDSDDISVLTRIESQVNFLQNNEEYGVCSVNISMMDELGNIYNNSVYPDSIVPHEWTFLWTNPIPNAPCMYRKNIIKDTNILFSNLKTAEDYEFLSHIILKNKIYMIPEALYLYRHTTNSLFNSNLKETFNNSLEISKNYLKQVVDIEIPQYYENLTCFQDKDTQIIAEDIKVVNRFLIKIAEKFKEYFNWNEKDYDIVVDSIPEVLERYAIIKNNKVIITPENNIGNARVSTIKRALVKLKNYYKKFGFKKTVKTILKKIKDRIWKKR